jgi:hypothetical protein
VGCIFQILRIDSAKFFGDSRMKITGLDSLSKQLEQLAENAEELSNTKSSSFDEILTPDFMSRHTKFSNANNFFEASGFNVIDQTSFDAFPEDKLNIFVDSVSSFGTWRELLNTAGAEWVNRKLGL